MKTTPPPPPLPTTRAPHRMMTELGGQTAGCSQKGGLTLMRMRIRIMPRHSNGWAINCAQDWHFLDKCEAMWHGTQNEEQPYVEMETEINHPPFLVNVFSSIFRSGQVRLQGAMAQLLATKACYRLARRLGRSGLAACWVGLFYICIASISFLHHGHELE